MAYQGLIKSVSFIAVSGFLGGLCTFGGQRLLGQLNSVDFKESFSGQYFSVGFLGSVGSAFLMSGILKIRACLRNNPPDDFFNSFSMLDSLIKLGFVAGGSVLILIVASAIVNQADQILRPVVANLTGSFGLALVGGSLGFIFKAAVLLLRKKPAVAVTPFDLETGSDSEPSSGMTTPLEELEELPVITPANTPRSLSSPEDLSTSMSTAFFNGPASPPAGTGEALASLTPPASPLFHSFIAAGIFGFEQTSHAPYS